MKSLFALLVTIIASSALAAQPVVELSAEAVLPAANDLARATVFAEASGTAPGELSKQVNQSIAEALKTARAYPGIKTQSSGSSTYPVYAKNGKIESWRMRSEILLESGDTAALSELLGKLQASLGVSSLVMQPSPETRRKAENEAMLEAVALFRERAKLLAGSLGKGYTIKQLAVNTEGRIIQPRIRAAARVMASDAAPMPMESGESQVSVSISGKIELE